VSARTPTLRSSIRRLCGSLDVREPSLSPVGIQHVIVNGVSVVVNGQAVDGVAPGKRFGGAPR